MGTLGAGVYLMLGGHLPACAPALSGSRRRRSNLRGAHEVEDLHLFINNDGRLHESQTLSIIKNLQNKLKKGTFDKAKSVQAWMYLVESGAKKYAKDFNMSQPWHKVFSMADRRAVAKALAEEFVSEYVR